MRQIERQHVVYALSRVLSSLVLVLHCDAVSLARHALYAHAQLLTMVPSQEFYDASI